MYRVGNAKCTILRISVGKINRLFEKILHLALLTGLLPRRLLDFNKKLKNFSKCSWFLNEIFNSNGYQSLTWCVFGRWGRCWGRCGYRWVECVNRQLLVPIIRITLGTIIDDSKSGIRNVTNLWVICTKLRSMSLMPLFIAVFVRISRLGVGFPRYSEVLRYFD